jgi:hypothetical protein
VPIHNAPEAAVVEGVDVYGVCSRCVRPTAGRTQHILNSNDALQVTGAAILGGTLQLNLLSGFQPKISDQLTLVAAGGGVSGKFANLLDSFSPVITPELIYGPNTVLLEFSSNFGSFALTPNQRAAGNLLDRVAFNPKTAELISFLFNEPVATTRAGGARLRLALVR